MNSSRSFDSSFPPDMCQQRGKRTAMTWSQKDAEYPSTLAWRRRKKMEGSKSRWAKAATACSTGNQSPGPAKPPREAPWLGPPTSRPHLSMAAACRPLHFKQFRFPAQPQNWAPTSPARASALIQTPLGPNLLFTSFVWDARSNWILLCYRCTQHNAAVTETKHGGRLAISQTSLRTGRPMNETSTGIHKWTNASSPHTPGSPRPLRKPLERGYSIHPLASGTKGTTASPGRALYLQTFCVHVCEGAGYLGAPSLAPHPPRPPAPADSPLCELNHRGAMCRGRASASEAREPRYSIPSLWWPPPVSW